MVDDTTILKHSDTRWPTITLALVIFGSWLGLTWFHDALPVWAVVPLGAWTIAWFGSLQHEVIHGHPTRRHVLNNLMGTPPLQLWLPYARYRALHLAHHRDDNLTDPLDDPETNYWTSARYARLSPVGHAIVRANATLLGRLTIGPFWSVGRFLWREAKAVHDDVPGRRRIWLRHGVFVALVLAWVGPVCGIPVWQYILEFVLPGTSLSLIRSYAEHRAAPEAPHRTAIVEHAPIFGLLFLYNNLHVVHHLRPGLPWYAIPGWYAANRAALLARNGGLVYHGYRDLFARYLLKPHDQVVHPFRDTVVTAATPVPGSPGVLAIARTGG